MRFATRRVRPSAPRVHRPSQSRQNLHQKQRSPRTCAAHSKQLQTRLRILLNCRAAEAYLHVLAIPILPNNSKQRREAHGPPSRRSAANVLTPSVVATVPPIERIATQAVNVLASMMRRSMALRFTRHICRLALPFLSCPEARCRSLHQCIYARQMWRMHTYR